MRTQVRDPGDWDAFWNQCPDCGSPMPGFHKEDCMEAIYEDIKPTTPPTPNQRAKKLIEEIISTHFRGHKPTLEIYAYRNQINELVTLFTKADEKDLLQAQCDALKAKADALDWFESYHTLHKSLEVTYCVDHIQLVGLYDDNPIFCHKAPTLRLAIDHARQGEGKI